MTVIVCVDDRGGMRFHGRRQSRDRVLCADVLRLCGRVRMNAASAALFQDCDGQIQVCEDFLQTAGPGDACFVEDGPLSGLEIDTLILYRWNRVYPGDVFLDFRPDAQGMTLVSSEEFSGSSHKRITREIWRKHHGETQRP